MCPDASSVFGITDFRQAQDGSFWIVTTAGIMRRLPDGREIFYGVENTRTDLFRVRSGRRFGTDLANTHIRHLRFETRTSFGPAGAWTFDRA